jgi:PAP2 superfamily
MSRLRRGWNVLDLELSWPQAAVCAAALAAASVTLRATSRPRIVGFGVVAQESALVLGLFALWQLAGSFALTGPERALARARWIWDAEQHWHLPDEASLQQLILPHPLLVQFSNLYYDSLHFPVLIACMIWLFVRYREHYRRFRTTLVTFTAGCLLIQLIPVAPPRMLTSTGMVDTAVLYHQSVYAAQAGFNADELSAMPSVHVGWAVLVAVAVIGTARTKWRWLALLYPALTTLAVVVTANHFWLDGVVAVVLLGAVLAVQLAVRRLEFRTAVCGLSPRNDAWHHPRNTYPLGTGGSNGRSSAADEPGHADRTPPGRNRAA